MIRAIHLADIVPLLLFLSKSPVDVAKPWGSACGEGHFAPLLRRCLTSGVKQCSYVCVHRGLIDGLISYRSCRGAGVWEIESLLMGNGREECSQRLLDGAGPLKDSSLTGRLFLRVEAESQGLDVARKAGFSQYLTEFLYVRETTGNRPLVNAPAVMKPKASTDEYGLFRLYSAIVPLRIRNVEGMTFQEWSDSRDRGSAREWVVYREGGEIWACLKMRSSGSSAQFSVMSSQAAGDLDSLIDHSISLAGGKKALYCFVQDHQAGLPQILENKGFRHVAEYTCLSKQAAIRVRDPRLVPLRA